MTRLHWETVTPLMHKAQRQVKHLFRTLLHRTFREEVQGSSK
jgi:hypothetical protein